MNMYQSIWITVLVVGLVLPVSSSATLPDSDLDLIPDVIDNCVIVFNPSQNDSNGDGMGNACDADLNNDGIVGGPDFAIFRANFALVVPPGNPDADLEEPPNAFINFADFLVLANDWRTAPGPSASTAAVPALSGWGIGLFAFFLLSTAWASLRLRRSRSGRRLGGVGTALGIALLAIAIPSGEVAAQQVDLVWTATTGAGTPGTDTIQASAGDVLTAEVLVTPTAAGISLVSVSLTFDADLVDELDFFGAAEDINVLVDGHSMNSFDSFSFQESSGEQAGSISSFEHFILSTPVPTVTTWRLAQIEFTVTANVAADGADVTVGFDTMGVDGVWSDANTDISESTTLGTLTVNP